ncbi:MAG: alkaline phosphatase family protein [Pirellulales bacterium]
MGGSHSTGPNSGRRARLRLSAAMCLVFAFTGGAASQAAELPAGRVLFIGIDGCRFDALEKAETPNLDRLRENGCYTDKALILGERYRKNETISGPGWSSLLTGVWADKHGVHDNKFRDRNFGKFPPLFVRVKQADLKGSTISSANWPPIAQVLSTSADVNLETTHDDLYVPGDAETAKTAAELLRGGEPIVVFTYFGQVDERGHKRGFSPDVAEYVGCIEQVDKHVGELLAALESRKNFAAENWLAIVSSDHGGIDKDHAGGHSTPEVLNSFIIVERLGGAARQDRRTGLHRRRAGDRARSPRHRSRSGMAARRQAGGAQGALVDGGGWRCGDLNRRHLHVGHRENELFAEGQSRGLKARLHVSL